MHIAYDIYQYYIFQSLLFKVNIIAADGLAMEGTRASAAIE